MHTYSN